MSIRKNPWRWIFLWLALLWMVFIFMMSAADGKESTAMSGRFVTLFQKAFYPNWEMLPEEDYLMNMGKLLFMIRKAAHFSEYVILGALFSLFMMTFLRSFGIRFLLSISAGILYAVSDELHQLFVPEREGAVFDILIDSAGVFIGCMLVLGGFAMVFADRRFRS